MYEHFEHTADIGLRARAAALPELFAETARGFSALIVPNLDSLELVVERTIALRNGEIDYLLFDWLNELLFLFESERLVFRDFAVSLEGESFSAVCRGQRVDPQALQLEHEVKAVTYHELKVEPIETGWLAEVIFDI